MNRVIFLRILIELLGWGLYLDVLVVVFFDVHCQVLLFRMVRSYRMVLTQ